MGQHIIFMLSSIFVCIRGQQILGTLTYMQANSNILGYITSRQNISIWAMEKHYNMRQKCSNADAIYKWACIMKNNKKHTNPKLSIQLKQYGMIKPKKRWRLVPSVYCCISLQMMRWGSISSVIHEMVFVEWGGMWTHLLS